MQRKIVEKKGDGYLREFGSTITDWAASEASILKGSDVFRLLCQRIIYSLYGIKDSTKYDFEIDTGESYGTTPLYFDIKLCIKEKDNVCDIKVVPLYFAESCIVDTRYAANYKETSSLRQTVSPTK
ncbi:11252_t:CDS:2 [Gigaspora rosea]|nr:11252_t:CDS:2 [Gigaspora rosea]